jgi:hypothetical protein
MPREGLADQRLRLKGYYNSKTVNFLRNFNIFEGHQPAEDFLGPS